MELCPVLDPRKPAFAPKKGKPSIVVFVGLQGSGKTHDMFQIHILLSAQGFKPSLIRADTFRAGGFHQLKQNATKAKIPFHGSMESDTVKKIVVEGLERFREVK